MKSSYEVYQDHQIDYACEIKISNPLYLRTSPNIKQCLVESLMMVYINMPYQSLIKLKKWIPRRNVESMINKACDFEALYIMKDMKCESPFGPCLNDQSLVRYSRVILELLRQYTHSYKSSYTLSIW